MQHTIWHGRRFTVKTNHFDEKKNQHKRTAKERMIIKRYYSAESGLNAAIRIV